MFQSLRVGPDDSPIREHNTPMSNLAVSYAAIILADADVEITAEKLLALTKAANIEDIEPIFAQIYASAISKADKKELLAAFGATAGAAAGASGAAASVEAGAAGEAAPAEEKKEEAEESDDMDMGMLF